MHLNIQELLAATRQFVIAFTIIFIAGYYPVLKYLFYFAYRHLPTFGTLASTIIFIQVSLVSILYIRTINFLDDCHKNFKI